MGKNNQLELDFSKLLDGDIFFSHAKNIVGGLIRTGEKAEKWWDFFRPSTWGAATDRTMPNHTGFIYSIRGQLFAAQVGENGIELTSLDEYRNKNNFILYVMRFQGFEDVITREKFMNEMAIWVRRKQDAGYDIFGALGASIGLHKLFPWLKNNSKKEFCSEDVYTWLKKYNAIFPLTWEKHPPNPLQLYNWMKSNHHYREIN